MTNELKWTCPFCGKSSCCGEHRPSIVPFDHLPREQQAKDYIFRAVVHALSATTTARDAAKDGGE